MPVEKNLPDSVQNRVGKDSLRIHNTEKLSEQIIISVDIKNNA
jgi:hypothetical protein